jgi:hypothetical protein
MAVGLPEAPQLNLSNPSIEAASGFAQGGAHAYAAGLQFAQALREAAFQQQKQEQAQKFEQVKLDQQKANDLATEQRGLLQLGGYRVPKFDPVQIGNTGQPTLARDNHEPADDPRLAGIQQGDFHLHYASNGEAWYMPDKAQAAASEAQAKELPLNENNSVTPGQLGDAFNGVNGLAPDQRIPFKTADSLMGVARSRNASKNAAPAPHWAPDTLLGPSQLPLMEDPNKPGTFIEPNVPAGSKMGMTQSQQSTAAARQQSEADRNQRTADAAADRNQRSAEAAAARKQTSDLFWTNKHDETNVKEQAEWAKKQAFYDAAHPVDANGNPIAPDDKSPKSIPDPRKPGEKIKFTTGVQRMFMTLSGQAEKQAGAYQKAQRDIRQRMGWGEFGQQSQQGAPTNSAGATPAQTAPAAPAKAQQQQTPAKAPPAQGAGTQPQNGQAKGRLTDTGKAAQYLQRAGGDKNKARQLAKADGWDF